MTMHYTVAVSDWTEPRGYRNSGRGWRCHCFGLPDDDWNSLGVSVFEHFYPTEGEARAKAAELKQTYNAKLLA